MASGKRKEKRRRGDDDGGDGPTWLTTYADAITLLMAFFVILYAMSQVDQVKFEALIAGFAEPFGNDNSGRNSGNISLLQSGSGLLDFSSSEVSQHANADPFSQMLERDPVAERAKERIEDPATEAEDDAEQPPGALDVDDTQLPDSGLPLLDVGGLEAVRDRLQEALVLDEDVEDVDFEITGNQLVVSLPSDDVLFRTGSAVLEPRGREVVGALAPLLNEFANVVEVVGHTDDVPLDRNGYTNWDLSGDRALAVLDVLRDEFALAPQRLGYRGYADQRPRVANDSPQNRSRNRRVELVIVAST